MVPGSSSVRNARSVAIAGGIIYALVILLWATASGVHLATDDPASTAIGIGYASVGMFLLGAVPLYLLGRGGLVSPLLATAWLVANTRYQQLFVARPHGALASHLTVWPILLAAVVAVGLVEFGVRVGLDRGVGRFGPRSVF